MNPERQLLQRLQLRIGVSDQHGIEQMQVKVKLRAKIDIEANINAWSV